MKTRKQTAYYIFLSVFLPTLLMIGGLWIYAQAQKLTPQQVVSKRQEIMNRYDNQIQIELDKIQSLKREEAQKLSKLSN